MLAEAITLIMLARTNVAEELALKATLASEGEAAPSEASFDRPEPHEWIQQGLAVTHDSLDVGIHGQGFFLMADTATGERHVTRDGILKVDTSGYLVHWQRGDRLLQCAESCAPINIAAAAWHNGAPVVKFKVSGSGEIDAFYRDGRQMRIATLALVDFARPRRLRRIDRDVLLPTAASGEPQIDHASGVYGASHELLDEAVYRSVFAKTRAEP